MKKWLTMIAMLVVCTALLLVPSLAATVDSGTCGTNVNWTLDSNGLLNITGRGTISPNAFYGNDEIEAVTINAGVTGIGELAFYNCGKLTSVKLPAGLTTIGSSAFSGCEDLTTIDLSKGVTYIGSSAFYNCSSLTAAKLSSGITYLGSDAFNKCARLKTVTIPAGVTEIWPNTFAGCKALTSIKLPEGVTSIGKYAFQNCSALTSITIPASATEFDIYAFSGCSSLTTVKIPKGTTVIPPYLFKGCKSLTKVIIPAGVISVGNAAFDGCTALTAVDIPSGMSFIGGTAFSGCTALKNVYFGGTKAQWDAMGITFGKGVTLQYNVEPLVAPAVTVTTSASTGKPVIKWKAVEDATGYEVYRCNTKSGTYTKLITTGADKLSVTHTGAVAGNDYFYKVRAVRGEFKSAYSAAKGVWCDLARPTITVTTRASDGKPLIKWSAVKGATGYKVYCADSSKGTYKLIYTAKADKLSVAHLGAVAGQDYFYKVKAIYSGNSKCDSALTAYKGVWCDLARPALKVALKNNKPVLSWEKVTGATGYKVYRSTNGKNWSLLYTANANKLSITHTGAAADTTYYYKMFAVYGSNTKCNSAYSVVKTVSTK